MSYRILDVATATAVGVGFALGATVGADSPFILPLAPTGGGSGVTVLSGEALEKPDLPDETEIRELSLDDAERFELLQPIPVKFKTVEGHPLAYVPGADLAFTGEDRQDALEHLVDWILGVYEDLLQEDPDTLDVRPANQLRALKEHLRPRS